MTDEKLKQRCLELGYDEQRINDIIRKTNAWSNLQGKYGDYFGKLFGSKYDDEKALREVIDNWDSLLLLDAIREDKAKNPDDYKLDGLDDESLPSFDEWETCVNVGRGPWPRDEDYK